MDDKVVFVLLRQPNKSDPDESRSDPFYEFGCFGLTGCHQTNLLNDTSATGTRLAFVQGGPGEMRLVFVTPPAKVEWRGTRIVATWTPAEMPLRFEDAPVLVASRVLRRNSALLDLIERTNRTTPVGKFSSRFRSRKEALLPMLAAEVLQTWNDAFRVARRSQTYVEALPYPPNRPLTASERKRRFDELLRDAGAKPGCRPKPDPTSR